MTSHWNESNVNISHIGMQELQHGETSEASDNILWNTRSSAYRDAKDQAKKDHPNDEKKQKAKIRELMVAAQKGDHSMQVDGAAEVFSLLGDGKPSIERIKYEKIRESSIASMRKNATYQFCMLLAGFNNVKISKYWITPSEAEVTPKKYSKPTIKTEHGNKTIKNVDPSKLTHVRGLDLEKGSAVLVNLDGMERQHHGVITDKRTNNNFDVYVFDFNERDSDGKFHRWYVQTAWADGTIHLSPEIYAHLDEAYTMVTGKWAHLKNVGMDKFIETPSIRTYFARLVSWNMRTSDCLSGKRYHLQSTYARVNHEKARILSMFKYVRVAKDTLVVDEQVVQGRYIPGTQTYTVEQKYLDQKQLRDSNGLSAAEYIGRATSMVRAYNKY